jgi:hypothetical protein
MSKTCNIQEKGSNADAKGTQIVSSTRMQKELQGNAMIKFCHVTEVTECVSQPHGFAQFFVHGTSKICQVTGCSSVLRQHHLQRSKSLLSLGMSKSFMISTSFFSFKLPELPESMLDITCKLQVFLQKSSMIHCRMLTMAKFPCSQGQVM